MPCQPVELIVLAVKAMNVRCRCLPEREIVVLRPADGTEGIAEGEILKVLPTKEWRYKGTIYISGRVVDSSNDGSILTPVPLKLFLRTAWDPYDDFAGLWGVDADGRMPAGLPEWVQAVLKAGRRLVYEMEQIIPGADPDGLADPIDVAVECAYGGDLDTAFGIGATCTESSSKSGAGVRNTSFLWLTWKCWIRIRQTTSR
ncbi:MAG: hypothetical protein K6U04_14995 [Armatimonadetes bacterium]|nr:hypothetical protein [Armatimonadota bacterium]